MAAALRDDYRGAATLAALRAQGKPERRKTAEISAVGAPAIYRATMMRRRRIVAIPRTRTRSSESGVYGLVSYCASTWTPKARDSECAGRLVQNWRPVRTLAAVRH